MPMVSEKNVALRLKGWRVFRSSTRDHLIPMTGAGAILQRVKIFDALPVGGVAVGQEAIDLTIRAQISDDRQKVAEKVFELARDRPTGETVVLSSSVGNPTANPGPAGNIVDDVLLIGSSPFSGFITEATWRDYVAGGSVTYLAIRTGSGGSLFLGGQTFAAFGENINSTPDFTLTIGGDPTISARRMRVPVLAGEQIFAIVRTDRLQAADGRAIQITLTFESAEGAPIGARALLSSIGANRQATGEATRNAFLVQRELGIEQEKTKRAIEVETLKVEQARALGEQRRGNTNALQNPYNQVLASDEFIKQLQAQKVTPAPPPRVPAPPANPPEGAGKTFVSAWNPSFGSIGYLIPNPPIGGKVNVFDSRYSVFDITGKLIEQGPIEPVMTDAQIPPGARISRNLGVKLSPGIETSTYVPGVGFV